MNNQLYRVQGLKGIIDLIRLTANSHVAVSEFIVGVQLESDTNVTSYPVAYLESDITSDIDIDSETFSVALSVGDRLPRDYSSEDLINGKTKTSQILDEIHYQIENLASNILVTGMNKIYYENVNQDSIVVCRGEFTIEIARYTAKLGTPYDMFDIGQNQNLCQPVTITNPNDNTTVEIPAGGTYTVPVYSGGSGSGDSSTPVFSPVTVYNPNDDTTVLLNEGETYAVPLFINPTVIDNVNGVTKQLEQGETYTVNDAPDLYQMSFNFGVEAESGITVTITSEEAAVYSTQVLTNCTAVYRKNTVAVNLPVTLVAGDVFSVEVTKNNLMLASKVVLNS